MFGLVVVLSLLVGGVCIIFSATEDSAGKFLAPPGMFWGIVLMHASAFFLAYFSKKYNAPFFLSVRQWLMNLNKKDVENMRNGFFILFFLCVAPIFFESKDLPIGRKAIYENYVVSLMLNVLAPSLSAFGFLGWIGSILVNRSGGK